MTEPRVEILCQPNRAALPTPWHTTTDPNQAALAFHVALKRLSAIPKLGTS